MGRKRIVWFLGVLLVVLAALLVPFGDFTPQRQLAVSNYSLLRLGMTQAEVEALLGGPPGNYGRHAGGTTSMTMEGYLSPAGAVELIWCNDANRFEIYFDANQRVVGFHQRAGYSQSPPEGFLRWLWRMIGR